MALESIALIPSGVKATKVYSQLPVNGNGDFTFDRGTSTTQTRVNKNGLIESVAQDVPRLDYLDGGCPSLLLEPASENLITYSEDFGTSWGLVDANISTDVVLSPDGSVNADKLVEDATTAFHFTDFSVIMGATPHTFSVFMKSAERTSGSIFLSQSGNFGAVFDLSSGSVTSVSGTGNTASIEDYGNGWYRCSVTNDGTADIVDSVRVGVQNGAIASYAGDGTSGIYIYGAQAEQKSYATSYIPTSGATETRDAETCNGAGTTAEINSQEGVLFGEFRGLAETGVNRYISLNDGTSNNRLVIRLSNSDGFGYYAQNNPTTSTGQATTIDITQYSKVALYWSGSVLRLYVNGLFITEDSSWTAFSSNTLDRFDCNNSAGSLPFHGRVKKLSVYDQALSTTELETLTGFTSFAEMSSYLSYS